MELKVIVRGVEDPSSVRSHAHRRVETALRRYAAKILTATVRLTDETGPRKEKDDKVCAIDLKLRTESIRVKEISTDFKTSISLALNRIRAVLSRNLGKTKRGVGAG